MSTLLETAYYTRKAIKYGVIALVAFFILKFAYGIFLTHWKTAHPPPPPPPEVKFGKIPKIEFPTTHYPQPILNLTYYLQTIEGIPPNLPGVGKVYFMPQSAPNLLAVDRAKQRAQKIGFDQLPTRLSATAYRWEGKTDPPTTLELDVISGHFKLKYPYEDDQSLLTNQAFPSKPQVISLAQNFLTAFESLPLDLAQDQAEVEYLKFAGGRLVPVIALSEAQFARVNFFRKNLDDLPIFPPNPKQSLINFLISVSSDARKRIVEANYTYNQIERETFSTYPLKSSAQAWQELQAGQGYIANLGRNENGKIAVRRIYLTYFESEKAQRFLQPIFVFEGDNNFYAYVSAIDSTMTE